MLIQFLGFQLNLGSTPGLPALIQAIKHRCQKDQESLITSMQASEVQELGDSCVLACTSLEGGLMAGAMIKMRNVKSLLSIKNKQGQVTLGTHKLALKERIVECNFFVLSEATGAGLYSHYHQSLQLNTFCKNIGFIYEGLCRDQKQSIRDQAESKQITKKDAEEQIGNIQSLKYTIIPPAGTVEEMVKTLSQIKKVSIQFKGNPTTRGDMAPLEEEANSVTHTFTFSQEKSVKEKIVDPLVSFIKGDRLKRMTVTGTDPDQMDRIIHLENNHQAFHTIDYTAIADGNSLINFDDLAASLPGLAIVKSLQKTINAPHTRQRLGL